MSDCGGAEPKKSKRGKAIRWTPHQLEMLEKLRREGNTWPFIAARCGHTATACSSAYLDLKMRREDKNRDRCIGEQRRPWSDEDMAELVRLREVEKLPYTQIDIALNRSFGGCRTKYEAMNGRRQQKTYYQSAGNLRRKKPTEHIEPSPIAIADRDERYQAWLRQSPAAALMGEPLPGRSALDLRRQGGAQ